jgi:hypothetical protein
MDNSLVVFGQRFPGEKGSETVRLVMQQPLLFVVKVRSEVFSHFHAVAVKRHSSMRNCLTCQYELFMNNPLDVKENDEHAIDFALHLSRLLFGLSEFEFSVYGSSFLP